jgi:hypothetical protein
MSDNDAVWDISAFQTFPPSSRAIVRDFLDGFSVVSITFRHWVSAYEVNFVIDDYRRRMRKAALA